MKLLHAENAYYLSLALKFHSLFCELLLSLSTRRGWIEMYPSAQTPEALPSLSTLRGWTEIGVEKNEEAAQAAASSFSLF